MHGCMSVGLSESMKKHRDNYENLCVYIHLYILIGNA